MITGLQQARRHHAARRPRSARRPRQEGSVIRAGRPRHATTARRARLDPGRPSRRADPPRSVPRAGLPAARRSQAGRPRRVDPDLAQQALGLDELDRCLPARRVRELDVGLDPLGSSAAAATTRSALLSRSSRSRSGDSTASMARPGIVRRASATSPPAPPVLIDGHSQLGPGRQLTGPPRPARGQGWPSGRAGERTTPVGILGAARPQLEAIDGTWRLCSARVVDQLAEELTTTACPGTAANLSCATPAIRHCSSVTSRRSGATAAVRSSSTVVAKPSAAASMAVARTQ